MFSEDESFATEDQVSSSIDEFATNELEISLDAKTTQQLKDKILKKKKNVQPQIKEERGVIYLGHIPYGFFEEQMKGFFSQFGIVTNLRLSRSKKTGKSRGYAFVEFEDKEVAEIVAETMNDYLMFGRRLKCEVVPPEKLNANTFRGSNKRFIVPHTINKHRAIHNKKRSAEDYQKSIDKLLEKEEKRRKKIEEFGIDYEFPGYSAIAKSSKDKEDK